MTITKINDSRYYLYASGITFIISVILALIFSYSAFIIEPRIEELLTVKEGVNINENLKNAFLILKDPQIFARYEHYDRLARPIESIIKVYDKKLNNNEAFVEEDIIYLNILLDRRIRGSELTRDTMIFFLLIAVLGMIFYIYEKIQMKRA